ncbi:MAG: 4-hydroxy-3-methylbut-2-en-1-yl diphosphate synthase [Tannerella sp.]|nr:4-hydroxy-3-methylbut-2-en-1-yl diphosphate synthase [Tannerella sp.]
MNIRYQRRRSTEVHIGGTPLGGRHPIRIQSMADVSTMNTEAAVAQAIRIIEAGADYVRFTAQGEREARNLGIIREALRSKGYDTPLVADIHFNPRAADSAAANVEKVRINPGNYVDKARTFRQIDCTDAEYENEIAKIRERFIPFLQLCRTHGTAIRIGVNHGSLSDRIMSRYGDTPEGMVASCMEFLHICREMHFDDVVISVKASNTAVMIRTVRLLVRTMDAEDMHYPLHLGVTEAGDSEDGRIKSAVGIGTLLADGIGDTIRVSLSEPPEAEIPVARKLVDYILTRENHEPVDAPGACAPDADCHRETRAVQGIGGHNHPVVVSCRHSGEIAVPVAGTPPDFIYVGLNRPDTSVRPVAPLLVDADCFDSRPDTFPYFYAKDAAKIEKCQASMKFIELEYRNIDSDMLDLLRRDKTTVVVFNSRHLNPVAEMRALILRLKEADCDAPVILRLDYREADPESLQLKAAADFGAALTDGIGNGIFLCDDALEATAIERYMFAILQAARARISKTEYISCPGCGRTLYDLKTTIARVKAATSHLKGLKIAIMGCIVNGPGEMADADYGYVGAGLGRISLYKGRECIRKNIPEAEAVEQLIFLIKENESRLPEK